MIYNSVGYDCIDMENILADNENEGHLHMFDKDTIAKAVFDMKSGKSDGYDGLSSDYF